jgi:thiol-disulfide isomerase/thioredoxin
MLARYAATVAVGVTLAASGCKKDDASPAGGRTPDPAAAACAGAERKGSLGWFHDDYGTALACARARNVPLVIDMWAPWCHTCLSMQSYVLTDKAFAPYDGKFVFLALDTDRDANAAPVAKFPPAAWPTFFVVASTDESIQGRYVGSASIEQFTRFLDPHVGATQGDLAPIYATIRDGDRAAARKDWAAAEAAYEKALESPNTVERPDLLVNLMQVLSRQEKWAECAELASAKMFATGKAASASDFTAYALGCADGIAKADARQATEVRTNVVKRLTELTADPTAPLSVDDRSDALVYLREAHDALGEKDQARAAAARQRALLDEAAAKAPDPWVASTYNWPRSEVYTYLGVGLELVPALEKSVADLPEEYDPPHRLAWVYWKAGKLDQAREWATKAAALVYGPRKTRTLAMLADIEKARGDAAAERAARAEIVATWEKLPAEARDPDALAKAKASLAALDAPPPSPK